MSTSRKMLMAPLSMDKTKSLNVDAEENAQCGWEKDGMDLRRKKSRAEGTGKMLRKVKRRKKKRIKKRKKRANQRVNQRVRKTLKEKRAKMKRKKVKRRRRKAKTIQTKRKNLKMMESNKEKNQARKITHLAEVSLAEEVVERVVAHLAAHPAVRPAVVSLAEELVERAVAHPAVRPAVVSLAAKVEERAVAHPVVVRANKTTNPKKTNSLTPPRKKRKKEELKNLKMMVEMVTSWLTQSMNQDLRLRITILKKRTKNQKRTEKTKMVIERTDQEMELEMEPEMMVIERTAIERTATEKRVEMVNAQPPPELLTSLWMDLLKRKKKESPLRDSLKTTTQLKNTALQRISLHWLSSSKVSRTLNKITSLTLPPTTHPLDLSFLKTKEGLAI